MEIAEIHIAFNKNPIRLDFKKIGKGDQAMVVWWRLINGELPIDEAEKTKTALLEYCKLDTLEMVKIFEKLVEMIFFFKQNMVRKGFFERNEILTATQHTDIVPSMGFEVR